MRNFDRDFSSEGNNQKEWEERLMQHNLSHPEYWKDLKKTVDKLTEFAKKKQQQEIEDVQ